MMNFHNFIDITALLWYNYGESRWANAVFVNTDKYTESKAGTVIEQEDILGYYVWIPRYKYRINNDILCGELDETLVEGRNECYSRNITDEEKQSLIDWWFESESNYLHDDYGETYTYEEAVEDIETALENGSTTVEEIQNLFSNMNISLPPTAITTYKKPTKTTTWTESTVWDENNTPKTTTTKSTVVSEIELPWIGDNKPVFKTNEKGAYVFDESDQAVQINQSSSNKISGLTKNSPMDDAAIEDILNYDSNEKGETGEAHKKRIKSLNDEIEHYHEIEEVIELIEAKRINELHKYLENINKIL